MDKVILGEGNGRNEYLVVAWDHKTGENLSQPVLRSGVGPVLRWFHLKRPFRDLDDFLLISNMGDSVSIPHALVGRLIKTLEMYQQERGAR